jgi:hypothetical protein
LSGAIALKHNKWVVVNEKSESGDSYNELEKISQLKDKGIITQAEFTAKKKKILGL